MSAASVLAQIVYRGHLSHKPGCPAIFGSECSASCIVGLAKAALSDEDIEAVALEAEAQADAEEGARS